MGGVDIASVETFRTQPCREDFLLRPAVAAAFGYLGIMWGSTYLFIKIGLAYWPPFLMAFARNGIAALFLVAVIQMLRRPWPAEWRGWWSPLAFGVINGSAFALIFWGQRFIPSAQTAVLIATMPLFTLFLARWWLGEHLTWLKAFAVLLGFTGVFLAVGLGDREGAGFAGTESQRLAGQLAMLGAAACYATSYVFGKKYFQGDTYVNTAVHLASASLYLLLLSLLFDPPATAAVFEWVSVGSLLYLAIPGSALAYLAMFYLMKNAGSVQTSFFTVVNPIVALFLGVLLLGEALTGPAILGTVLVLASVWIVNKASA
jgi:drug/metabolite transporter (DMT)-like permease